MAPSQTTGERVAVYIDGYNVYHGLDHKGWRRFLWLDIRRLFERELRDHQRLEIVNYFTATGRRQSPEAAARHTLYLDALRATGGVEVRIDGQFRARPWKCSECGTQIKRPQEKRTDVAIAVQMVSDAYLDLFDTAWLMCADGDLVPAVQLVRSLPKIVVALPPRGRRSDDLIAAATAKRDISRARFAQAQLPDEIVLEDGSVLRRPAEWAT